MTKQELINKIKSDNLPVIISGAGIVGEALLSICNKEGIEVEAFCDNSTKAANTVVCGLPVIYMPELKTKYDDAVILTSVAAIKDVVDLINELGYKNWYSAAPLLKDYDASSEHEGSALDYLEFAIDNCIICHEGFLDKEKLFFRSIDLIITEKCSLKCRDCSNLMQYYENPKNCDTETLLREIDRFCELVDEVMDFRVIGGETFMNKEWPIIVERLIHEPKAKRVVLYTNATIVPKVETISLLQHEKVLIIATDYGTELSVKLSQFQEFCETNKIAYHILKIGEWLDCSSIKQQNRAPEENAEIFKLCCAKNMATLSDGKIFRCPYAANANRLNAVPDFKDDYVSIYDNENENLVVKSKIKKYLLSNKYLDTCDFCAGRPLAGNEVPPAVQTKKATGIQKV